MSFFLNEREDEGAIKWAGEWPFAARAHFIKSKAYDTLIRELSRYVKGDVPGRSFLIAGHRGAGKTSLVRKVVEDLNRAIIDGAVSAAATRGADPGRMLDQQRPLLVKLHGPSLLMSVKPDTAAPPPSSSPGATDSKLAPAAKDAPSAKDAVPKDPAAPPTDAAAEKPAAATAPAPPVDLTVTALEQITVALYRALAAEFSRSFANHARDVIYQAEREGRPRAQVADYLEIAGQFTLELDSIPRPGTLRAFYSRLGRVDAGVLWPFEVGKALLQAGLNDRGIREIVALSTAAQAFEVCSGTVNSTETDKNQQLRESSVETKGEAAFKDIANKISSLAVGTGVGALGATALNMPTALALGVGAWLLSTLTLSWTSKRSSKTERLLDYTFIRKRDKQSLERDLPLVIQRVREAGLAPVFMLDELDKLDDAATSIATLIKSLKHLTTDFGCFCFLTDRNYYDYLIAKVEREAFPVEHTYFSHFLFVLPHPDQFLDFLQAITKSVPVGTTEADLSTSGSDPAEATARAIFGLFVLHRSKFNMAEVLRELAEQCDAEGRLRPSPTDLRLLEYTFAASIQLAIGLILKRDGVRQRIEAESRFMQWVIDALYLLSRSWEKKEAQVKLSRDAIIACLLDRSGAGAPAPTDRETCLHKAGMGPLDLELIDRSVAALADLLCSSSRLKSELSKDGRSDLAELIPPQDLIRQMGETREFEFLYDMYGQEVRVRDQLKDAPAAANLPAEISMSIDVSLAFLRELTAALETEGLQIRDLVSLQILSITIDTDELERARNRLMDARTNDRPYDGLARDLPLVASVGTFMRLNGAKLAALFRLAVHVAADARSTGSDIPPLPLRTCLEAVARYVDLRTFFQQSETANGVLDAIAERPLDRVADIPADTADSVRAWHTSLQTLRFDRRANFPRLYGFDPQELWESWQAEILRHLTGGGSLVEPARYPDIMCFAAGRTPGSLFQRDLAQMSLAAWSNICASGFPSRSDFPSGSDFPSKSDLPSKSDVAAPAMPAWVFVAGLSAVGFGRAVLEQAIEIASLDEQQRSAFGALVSRAPEKRDGYILVTHQTGPSMASEPFNILPSSTIAILALPEESLKRYDQFIGWLNSQNALVAVVDEEIALDEKDSDLP